MVQGLHSGTFLAAGVDFVYYFEKHREFFVSSVDRLVLYCEPVYDTYELP